MKRIILIAVIILFTAHVNAQTGMPRELTCTEEAFNFSFSLGTKWKLSAPKMGPVEITGSWSDYIPGWSLKPDNATTETRWLPSVKKPVNVEASNHSVTQQNYASLFYYRCLSVMDQPAYLFPGIKWSPSINYKLLWPDFQVNSIGYHP